MSKLEALRMQVRALEGYHFETCLGDQVLPFDDCRLNAPLPHGGLQAWRTSRVPIGWAGGRTFACGDGVCGNGGGQDFAKAGRLCAMGFEPSRLLCARPHPLRPRPRPHRLGRLPEGRRGFGRHGRGPTFAGADRRCRRGRSVEPEDGAKAGRGGAAVGRDGASPAAASFQILEGRLWPERGCGHPLASERCISSSSRNRLQGGVRDRKDHRVLAF